MLVAVIALALVGSPSADLRVTVWPRGQMHASRAYGLRCGPAGGTLPHAATACRKLAAIRADPFRPPAPATVCTQIYGGPQVARVRGTFRRRHVDTIFSRRNGCEITRWDRLVFLFPVPR